MKRQRTVYTLVFTRNPDPYWQQRFCDYVCGEAEKRGMYVPTPAEIRQVVAEREARKAAASD